MGYKEKTKEQLIRELKTLQKYARRFQGEESERKKVEEEIKESEQRWRSLAQNIPDIILTVARDGKILAINRTVSGITVKEALGRNIYDYISTEHLVKIKKSLEQVFQTGKPDTYEVLGRGAAGPNTAWYETRVVPVKHNEQLSAAILISRDITERKRIEQMKNNLIRDVSHGLKTPIAMTEMALNLYSQGIKLNNRKQIRRAEQIALDNIKRLRKDVNNIIEVFTLDMRRTRVKKQRSARTSLKLIVNEIMQDIKYLADEKKLKLKVDIPQEVSRVRVDKRDLRVLLVNIIDNALKWTERGSICITSRLKGGWIEIKIKDTGHGIAIEDKDRVFDRFYKRYSAIEGTGLGLSICKEIVQIYKGKIKIVSQGIGKGTAVIVILPKT